MKEGTIRKQKTEMRIPWLKAPTHIRRFATINTAFAIDKESEGG